MQLSCWRMYGVLLLQNWTMDDALPEFTDVRAELIALLSLQPALQKSRKGEKKGKKQGGTPTLQRQEQRQQR